ncbi:MAG: cytochrome D1 domain-containing protein [Pseudomonadales bacterium]
MQMEQFIRLAMLLPFVLSLSAQVQAKQFLWQTNSAGNDIHVFDVGSFELQSRLLVGPEPHGIAIPDDARVIYVSVEANGRDHGELLWIDPRSLTIEHRIDVGREPHAIATTPDGRWVYVPCRDEHYWVIDAAARKVVTKIHTGGRPHNTQSSRDGRYMYLSPMGKPKGVTVVDVKAQHKVVGFIPFSESVRPPALSTDGSLLFQHVDGLNGFEVADVRQRKVIATVKHSTRLGWFIPIKRAGYLTLSGFKRCHGLALRPDQEEVWSTCAENLAVHRANGPSYPETHLMELPGKGYWITFSLDSRYAFVALSNRNKVAVIDAVNKQIVRELSVGDVPKRNIVVELPDITQHLVAREK